MVAVGTVLAALSIADQVSNVISVGLQVNDALTPTLVEVQNEADATGDSVGRLSLRLDTAFAALTNPVLSFKTAMSGLLSMFQNPGSMDFFTVAGAGFDFLKGKLDAAATIQTTMLNTSAAIANELGLTLAQSSDLAEKSISSLSASAAILPGETADYAAIYRQLASQIAKNNPNDTEGFNTQATKMSEKLGVLSATSGMDATEVGRQSARFLSGTVSIGEFRNLQLGENPLVMNALYDEMTKLGKSVDEWSVISLKERVSIFEKVLEKAVPKELTNSFEGTVESIFAGWDTLLFDPTTGMLGVLRRVESQGGRNLLEAFQGILQTFDRIRESVTNLMKSAGLVVDPMDLLISAFDWVNVQLNNLQDVIEGNMGTDSIIQTLQGMGNGVADWVLKGVDFVLEFLDNLSKNISGDDIGKIISQLYWTFEELTDSILTKIDWQKVGQIWADFEDKKSELEWRIFVESLKMIPLRMGNAITRFIAGFIVWWERDIMGTLRRLGKRIESIVNVNNIFRGEDGKLTTLGRGVTLINPTSPFADKVEAVTGRRPGDKEKAKEKEEKALKELRNKDASPIDGYVKPSKELPVIKNNNTKNSSNTTNNTINVSAMTQASPTDIASTILDVLNTGYANTRSMSYG